jgi:hypothetical protein
MGKSIIWEIYRGHFLFDHLAHISDDDSNKDDSKCAKWCPACFDSAIYFSWFDISMTFLGIIVASDFRKFLLFGTQQKESCWRRIWYVIGSWGVCKGLQKHILSVFDRFWFIRRNTANHPIILPSPVLPQRMTEASIWQVSVSKQHHVISHSLFLSMASKWLVSTNSQVIVIVNGLASDLPHFF